MRKKLTRYLFMLALLLGVIFFLQQIHWFPSFKNLFGSRPIVIDNTPVLVKEINNLSQLITLVASTEVVHDSTKSQMTPSASIPGFIVIPSIEKTEKLVLIGKGKVFAGINLAELKEKDVFVKGDSVSITIPKARIFQTIVNPSDFEFFEEKGKWTDDEVKAVKIGLRNKLLITVLSQNILYKAQERAKQILMVFLEHAGFKRVLIN
jgi:hypothetical protein